MITRDLVYFRLLADGERSTLNPDGSPMERAVAQAHLNRYPRDGYRENLASAETCVCCGSLEVSIAWDDGWRCARHRDSTPCRVEGCKRTGSRARYSETICAEHWRAGVPPGSPQRRVWLRLRRVAKRFGWTPERIARHERLWAWLKARCQSVANGDLDQREIDRLFGWDE